jgi:hypothetical protein
MRELGRMMEVARCAMAPHLVFITDLSRFSISDSFHIKELREFKHGGLVKGCPTPRTI